MTLINNPELAWQTRVVETYNQRNIGTLRDLYALSSLLSFNSTAELDRYIRDKEVVDVGSGFNGLAIDVLLRRLPTRVTSINPAFTQPYFEEAQIHCLKTSGLIFASFSDEVVELARQAANKNTYPFFAHNIGLPDESFDVAIDNCAVFFYADYTAPLALEKSIGEMMRICRRGTGKVRIGDFSAKYGTGNPNWKEQILISMGVEYTPLEMGLEIST